MRLSLASLCVVVVACGSPYGSADPGPRVDDATTTPGTPGGTTAPPTTDDGGVASTCGGTCVTQLALGDAFACALGADAKVRCWGSNDHGQTGGVDASAYGTPAVVSGLGAVKQIVTGTAHACALEDQGAVKCWGDDRNGVVSGVPSSTSRPMPTVVQGFPAAVLSLAAVSDSACAILVDGELWCWGNNEYGQLGVPGIGDAKPPMVVASPVKTFTDVVQVGASEETLCVRHGTGVVECIGRNFSGNLGGGFADLGPHPLPVKVTGLPSLVAQLGSGMGYHVAVALENGKVAAWGSNARQAIVADGTVFQVTSPRVVDGVGDVAEVAAGGYFTCARTNAGKIVCWGDASTGQAGLEPQVGRSVGPTTVTGLPAAQSIRAGRSGFACAVASGVAHCWGQNDRGQLGRGTVGAADERPRAVQL